MGRQSEQTLPNVMLEKGMFDDLKIVDLMEKYGPLGYTVYVVLLFIINDDRGYFTQMTPALAVTVQRYIGSKWISREKVIEVINFLAQCDLISSNLLEKGVLTSVGIQRRYLNTKKKSRATGYSIEKYWLLGKKQDDELLPHTNSNSCSNNSDKCSNNPDYCSNNSYINEEVEVEVEDEDKQAFVAVLKDICIDTPFKYTLEEYQKAMTELHDSAWAERNITCLSKIHALWDKLINGYYRDSTPRPRKYTAEEMNAMFADLNDDKL